MISIPNVFAVGAKYRREVFAFEWRSFLRLKRSRAGRAAVAVVELGPNFPIAPPLVLSCCHDTIVESGLRRFEETFESVFVFCL